jgi:hypothetical protein
VDKDWSLGWACRNSCMQIRWQVGLGPRQGRPWNLAVPTVPGIWVSAARPSADSPLEAPLSLGMLQKSPGLMWSVPLPDGPSSSPRAGCLSPSVQMSPTPLWQGDSHFGQGWSVGGPTSLGNYLPMICSRPCGSFSH